MLANFGGSSRPKHVTAAQYYNNRAQHNFQQAQHNHNQSYVNNDKYAREVVKNEERIDQQRRRRRYLQQHEEMRNIAAAEQMETQNRERALLADQDNKLASILADMELKKKSEEMNVRRICEESEELTKLRQLLRQAEVTKTRAIQVAEKDLMRKQEVNREARMDALMEEDRQKGIDKMNREAQFQMEMNLETKRILQDQIESRLEQQQRAYEEYLREKAVVDEVVRGLQMEDLAKMEAHRARQNQLKDNIKLYLEERARWREEQTRKAQVELQKIREYQKQQEERAAELLREKQTKRDGQDLVLQKLTREINAKRQEEEHMRQLLEELYQEEARMKADEDERKRAENQKRMRTEMIHANEYQKVIRQQMRQKEEEDEQEFRRKMYQKFAEDDRIAQMNAARRRRETAEYKREVERLVQERKKRFEESMEAEIRQREREQEAEDYRKFVIEKERQRLLTEHAAALLDYLPKGVLATDRDLQLLSIQPQGMPSNRSLHGTRNLDPLSQRNSERDTNARFRKTQAASGPIPGMSQYTQDTRFDGFPNRPDSRRSSAYRRR
jgi:hypothetical protein